MAVINKTGITNGSTIQAEHITRAIDALSGVSTDTIIATGSFSGSFKGDGSALTGITATSAQGVDLTNTTTGTGPYYPIFSSTTSTGAILRTDTSTFTYNATTNTLTATSSYANQALSSSFATSASISSNASGIVAIPGSTYNLTEAGKVTGNGLILPTTQPAQPIEGSTYFDPASQTLNVYYNNAWYNITLTIGG